MLAVRRTRPLAHRRRPRGLPSCSPRVPRATAEAEPEPSASVSDDAEPRRRAPRRRRTPRELSELEITPDGMGTLVIGEAPSTDPELQMLEVDPAACSRREHGLRTRASSRATRRRSAGFRSRHTTPPTDTHRGASTCSTASSCASTCATTRFRPTRASASATSRAAALAAYPEATVVEQWGTDVLVISGAHGVLHIEIAKRPECRLRRLLGRTSSTPSSTSAPSNSRRRGLHGRREREHRRRLPVAVLPAEPNHPFGRRAPAPPPRSIT